MLTQKEIKLARNAAGRVFNGTPFSCHALVHAQGKAVSEAEYKTNRLCKKYAKFFGIKFDHWEGLPVYAPENTVETQLQRQLMLELFAHLKGVLK